MKRFVEGADRGQTTLFPECLEDWIGEDNPVQVIDFFVDGLDLAVLRFDGVDPEATGRPLRKSASGELYQDDAARRRRAGDGSSARKAPMVRPFALPETI
jgi:hypothetical protein